MLDATIVAQKQLVEKFESMKDSLEQDEIEAYQTIIDYGQGEIDTTEAELKATTLQEILAIPSIAHPTEEEAFKAAFFLQNRGKLV
jgi:hypothetical protein